jgi:hypothetical protein
MSIMISSSVDFESNTSDLSTSSLTIKMQDLNINSLQLADFLFIHLDV